MSHYQHHVFFCSNQCSKGKACCDAHGATDARTYAKARVAEQGIKGRGRTRINKAGCLGRCGEGPVLVVYPEAVWYRYANIADIEEIVQEHLANGRVVERLRI